MAKKSFIDRGNPALQFISATREEVPEKKAAEEISSAKSAGKKGRGAKKEKAPERERQAAQSAQPVESAQPVKSAQSVGGEVKADMTAQPSAVDVAAAADSAAGSNKPETVVRSGHPVAPRRQGESKSKRVQLLVPPSLHMRVARKAAAMDMSFNEYVNQVLEKSIGRE